MKTAAVTAEYNPFHEGHARQYRMIKEKFGEDCRIVVIMSGPFVQRGEAAVMSREDRAEACLKAGASLVLELPPAFATASARDFARGAVRLLKASGICTDLVCGAECTDERILNELASCLNEEPEKFKNYLQQFLKEGMNFPAAREAALCTLRPERAEAYKAFLNAPNNILALEYQMAIADLNKNEKNPRRKLKLHLLPRKGDARSRQLPEEAPAENRSSEPLASASAIRRFLAEEKRPSERLLRLEAYIPPEQLSLLLTRPLVFSSDYEELMLQILSMQDEDYLLSMRYWDEGVAAGFRKAAEKSAASSGSSGGTPIRDYAVSRCYTETRFKRALLSALLGIRKTDWEMIKKDGPAFIRALAADKHGRYLLRLMRKTATLPRADKASDLLENLQSPLASAGLQQAIALGGDRLYRALAPDKTSIFDSYIKIR